MKSSGPVITQSTWVPVPSGLKVKSVRFTLAIGLMNSSRRATLCGGRLSMMRMAPSPTLSFPVHA